MKGRTTAMKGNRIPLFTGFVNFFSYFFLVPFSVKWDGINYVVKSSKLRKIYYIMGTIHVVVYYIYSSMERANVIAKQPGNVINIFEYIMQPCVSICQVYAAYVFLFQQNRTITLLQTFRFLSKPVSKLNLLGICFCLITCMLVTCVLLDPTYAVSHKTWISQILKYFIGDSSLSPSVEKSPFNITVELIYYIILPWSLQFCMPETFGIIVVLSLLNLALSYQSRLGHVVSVEKGYSMYKDYRNAIDKMNELWGNIFLVMYVADVIYFSRAPYVIMTENPDVVFSIFLLENIVMWGVGAHVHKTMTFTTKQWIKIKQGECDISVENRLKLVAINYEVDSEPIGIACTFFTLTYQFLGSMLGLLVAYALIIYQEHH